jgi:hypothetical protein
MEGPELAPSARAFPDPLITNNCRLLSMAQEPSLARKLWPSSGLLLLGPTGAINRLEEFVYHRAGAGAPKGYTGTWEGYEKAGPLLLSTDH